MKFAFCLLVLASVAFAEKVSTPQIIQHDGATTQLLQTQFFQCLMAETREKLEKFIDECKTETGIPEEMLTKARNGEKIDDPKIRQHALCLMKKTKMMNADGELQSDYIKERIKYAVSDEKEADRIMTECCIKKDTPLETAYATVCCFFKNKNSVTQ